MDHKVKFPTIFIKYPFGLLFLLVILPLGEPDLLDKCIQLLDSISKLIDRILIK